VIQVPDREALTEYLSDRGIDTGVHYPTPAHEHPAVLSRIDTPALPVTEALCDRILSLPMHPRLGDEEVDYVCSAIEAFYD